MPLLAGEIGLLEIGHQCLGDALHGDDIVVDVLGVHEHGAGIDEVVGQGVVSLLTDAQYQDGLAFGVSSKALAAVS